MIATAKVMLHHSADSIPRGLIKGLSIYIKRFSRHSNLLSLAKKVSNPVANERHEGCNHEDGKQGHYDCGRSEQDGKDCPMK
jgi:hypothetical protein